MTLQQLRFLVAVAQNNLNMTTAGAKLGATQPALSRQLKLLEEELGFALFVRNGRSFSGITAIGERVLKHAQTLLREVHGIKEVSAESRDAKSGVLSIGTTHTQARYVLPAIIQRFRAQYPDVEVHLHQGTVEQIAEMTLLDRIDLAMASGSRELFADYIVLPCYRWHRRIITPKDHPLTRISRPTLRQLAAWPLITYVFSFSGPSSLTELFASERLRPDVAITAQDSDVIKTYVRLGLGVGIIADLALEQDDVESLASIDAEHLFPPHTTWVGFRRGALLGRYTSDFLELLAPHLSRRLVAQARSCESAAEVELLFERLTIPVFQPPQAPGELQNVMTERRNVIAGSDSLPKNRL
jgi:LysR family transcriptional regulator, cys regulon transcriptional activator